ncbi:MAG: RDD family protein [Helicobacter sp.]|nr:RDD family protein [Helicobacter sp.]
MSTDQIEEMLIREELTIAPLWKRLVAHCMDVLLISMLVTGILWQSILQNIGDKAVLIGIFSDYMPKIFLLIILYQWIFIHLFGATIGKMVVRIRVVDIYYLDNPSWFLSFVRVILREIAIYLLYVPFIFMISNQFYRGLHDEISKTIVIELH